jgi:hypothetical protein
MKPQCDEDSDAREKFEAAMKALFKSQRVGATHARTIPAHKPIFRPQQESTPTVRPAPGNLRLSPGYLHVSCWFD